MPDDSQICRMPLSEAMRRALIWLAETEPSGRGRIVITKSQLERVSGENDGFVGLRDDGSLVIRTAMGS